MNSTEPETIKTRDIAFCELHPDRHQASSAANLLEQLPGVLSVKLISDLQISISYELSHVCLKQIHEVLIELGFHLNNTLMCRMKRSLYYYTEETQRVNIVHEHSQTNTRQVFVERYSRLNHDCTDERPHMWRHYR